MNTIPMTTLTLAPISECWLYQDRSYKYVKSGRIVTRSLPKVGIEYESLLDDLNIPYRLDATGTSYEIWDPACFEERNETFPMYIGTAGNYRMIKKYTGKLVSSDTVTAAKAIFDKVVKPKIDALEKEKQEIALIEELKKALNGRKACGIDCSINNALQTCKNKEMNLVHGNTHIKVMPVRTLMSEINKAKFISRCEDYLIDTSDLDFTKKTNYIAVFDMADLAVGTIVDIFVPEGSEPIFVGRKGWQVREWCEKLGGLLKINVKAAV